MPKYHLQKLRNTSPSGHKKMNLDGGGLRSEYINGGVLEMVAVDVPRCTIARDVHC